MKPNIKQLVADEIHRWLSVKGFSQNDVNVSHIRPDICSLGELAELLDLIPDSAIENAVMSDDAKEREQEKVDLHYHN
jgi:hypothetical protein